MSGPPDAADRVATSVPAFIRARRSIRSFTDRPVPDELVDAVLRAACLAPAPHHSRPWRWVIVRSPGPRRALAEAMADRWRRDLAGDGEDAERIDALVARSVTKLTQAPVAVLGCLTDEGLDPYPDPTRQQAERGMALLSLGAAIENLMLSATELGLASCWVAAPIFCPDEARVSLGLPDDWRPQALVLVGHPDPAYRAPDRPDPDLDRLRREL